MLTPLFRDCRGYMPPLLKSKTKQKNMFQFFHVLDHCLVPTTHILVCTHNHKSNLGQDLQYIRSKLGEYHRKKYYLQSQNNLKYQFPGTQYYLFSVYTTITNFCENKYDFFRTCLNFLLDIIKSFDSGKYISHYVLLEH